MIQKTFTITTNEVSQEQIWKVISNVNQWSTWDRGVEFAELQGKFESNASFLLRPKGGPKIKIQLVEVKDKTYFKDMTSFPLAKMYGEHWYEATAQGLKITVRMTITGVLSALWYQIVMKDIVAGLEEDQKALIGAAKKIESHANV
ncbi:MAG: SRPBCC family protein [Bacteroidetes bacterium]|nr:SRPBCC family protein [Bacteroidota bacterium]